MFSSIETLPLYFFKTDRKEINLGQNLRIRSITKEEKYTNFKDQDGKFHEGNGWGLSRGYNNLFFAVDSIGSETRREIEKLATCLLLYKVNLIEPEKIPTFELGYRGTSGHIQSNQLPEVKNVNLELRIPRKSFSYVLSEADIDSFVEFWTELTGNEWHRNLLAASRRLLKAQHRTFFDLDDKLIDMIIAFEALIIRKKEYYKRSKAAFRIARMQELTNEFEKICVTDIKNAYDLRNDAVHDGFFSKTNLLKAHASNKRFLNSYITKIEQYLRKCIYKYIIMMKEEPSKDKIINSIIQ